MGTVQIAISVHTCLTNDNHMFALLAHRAGALGTPAAGFCLVIVLDHFWFLFHTVVIHCSVIMHGAQEDNSLPLFQHIAHHGHVATESKFGAMLLPRFGWLHDRRYVRLVLAKRPHNGPLVQRQCLSSQMLFWMNRQKYPLDSHQNLLECLPRREEAVLAAKGGPVHINA